MTTRPATVLALLFLAAGPVTAGEGPSVYVYTCAGTIVEVSAKSGVATGRWEVSSLLPEEFAKDVRDGCLLNGLQVDRRARRLVAIVPKEPRTGPDGNRNHRLVAFLPPSMSYGGSVDLPVPTGQPPEITSDGRVQYLVPSDGTYRRYEIVLSPSKTPTWKGKAREIPDRPPRLDAAHRLSASLSGADRMVRPGLDGKFVLVEMTNGTLEVYDARTRKRLALGRRPDQGTFACLAPGGRLALYIVEGHLQAVRLPGGTPKAAAPEVRLDRTTTCVAAPR